MSIESILVSHLTRYPAMQPMDLYKLIHQAAMGGEHAVRDVQSARCHLTRELAEMGAGPDEPLLDLLSDETDIVRVHLRPYIAAGSEPARLLDAFLRTANEFRGDVRTLENYWQIATALGCFPLAEMDEFIQSMRAENYPAVHHSAEYRRLYRPAYRIIYRNFLDERFPAA